MATWKKVLLDGDAVGGTNLGSDNLTQSGTTRTFTLPNAGGDLIFRGEVGGATDLSMLQIKTNPTSSAVANSYVYARTLRIGGTSTTGALNFAGYHLPPHVSTDGGGKIMTTQAFTATSGATDFVTFDQWMQPFATTPPANSGWDSSSAVMDATDTNGSRDRLIYHEFSTDLYKPISVEELAKATGYMSTFNMVRESAWNSTNPLYTYFDFSNAFREGAGNHGDGFGYVTIDRGFLCGISFTAEVRGTKAPLKLYPLIGGEREWTIIFGGATYNWDDDENEIEISYGANSAAFVGISHTHIYTNPIPIAPGKSISLQGSFRYNENSGLQEGGQVKNITATLFIRNFDTTIAYPAVITE